ncbi:MAG: AbrB family transcriptional regulator [Alphaproteobacteria bacterium]|nr:AbrB family transcriptional regulator [Alphaproteobacteria bacterium]
MRVAAALRNPVWLAQVGLALALGAAGGAVANALGLPLAWMIGAMCATTVASVAGAPIAVPSLLRMVMITVLGIMLGSAFTPELFQGIPLWLPSLATLALYGAAATFVLFFYFRHVGGFDPVTAYFSAVPGGLSEMVVVGAAMGGDQRTISLVHGARVLLVVSVLPIWFMFDQGYVRPPGGMFAASILEIPLGDLAILAACAPAGAFAARRLRIPAAHLTGPMVLSAAIHVFGVTESRPPAELVAIAQIVVGAAIGARFAGVSARFVLRTLRLALGSTALMLALTMLFAGMLHLATGLPAPALVLAFAPGGLAEMSLIALALGIDAAFVSTHHIARIALLVVVGPQIYLKLKSTLRRHGGFDA